jgi:predicted RNA-binding protein
MTPFKVRNTMTQVPYWKSRTRSTMKTSRKRKTIIRPKTRVANLVRTRKQKDHKLAKNRARKFNLDNTVVTIREKM